MKACKQCLLDETDYPGIILDQDGICDMCHVNMRGIEQIRKNVDPDYWEKKSEAIRKAGKGKPYDCLIGISGGTDSTYMVYLAMKYGLRPLLFHVDGGWNSEKAVVNIARIVDKSGFDYECHVLPWSQMRGLQRAFIDADVLDIDLPFDNIFVASTNRIARKYKINVSLNGYNALTEGIMPPNFTHVKYDKRNIEDIFKKYGKGTIKDLPIFSSYESFIESKLYNFSSIYFLNTPSYSKTEAKQKNIDFFGWQDYGGKHYENIFTRLYQGYILPEKFGIDKRKSHLSMLICNGEHTRDEAMAMLKSEDPYPDKTLLHDDIIFFCKKLEMSEDEFRDYLKRPPRSHREFRSILDDYEKMRPIKRFVKKVLGRN